MKNFIINIISILFLMVVIALFIISPIIATISLVALITIYAAVNANSNNREPDPKDRQVPRMKPLN